MFKFRIMPIFTKGLKRRIQQNFNNIKELKDDPVELPRFLASCKYFYNLIAPSKHQVQIVIDAMRLKVNNPTFLAIQNKELKSFADFEAALKDQYYKKMPLIVFYVKIFDIKQEDDESVKSFARRLLTYQKTALVKNDGHNFNLDKIMIEALSSGLNDNLKDFARNYKTEDFDELVEALKEQESIPTAITKAPEGGPKNDELSKYNSRYEGKTTYLNPGNFKELLASTDNKDQQRREKVLKTCRDEVLPQIVLQDLNSYNYSSENNNGMGKVLKAFKIAAKIINPNK